MGGIRVAVSHGREIDRELATFAHQTNAPGIQIWPTRNEGPQHWTEQDLRQAQAAAAEHGVRVEAIAMHFYPRAMLGLPGRDEQIEDCIATIESMGRTGVGIIGYDWNPNGVWRTRIGVPLRHGVTTNGFDMTDVEQADAVRSNRLYGLEVVDNNYLYSNPEYRQVLELAEDDVVDEERVWDAYDYFLKAVLPVAEQHGVMLAVHPDDPPVPMLGGIARILRSPDHYRRAMRMADSPAWGVLLCIGTVSEMAGETSVNDMIDTFAPAGRIGYVHFRDVVGTVPRFHETFLGAGNYDPVRVMRRLRGAGYDGFIMDDHVPVMDGDDERQRISHAFAMGYLHGLIRATDDA